MLSGIIYFIRSGERSEPEFLFLYERSEYILLVTVNEVNWNYKVVK